MDFNAIMTNLFGALFNLEGAKTVGNKNEKAAPEQLFDDTDDFNIANKKDNVKFENKPKQMQELVRADDLIENESEESSQTNENQSFLSGILAAFTFVGMLFTALFANSKTAAANKQEAPKTDVEDAYKKTLIEDEPIPKKALIEDEPLGEKTWKDTNYMNSSNIGKPISEVQYDENTQIDPKNLSAGFYDFDIGNNALYYIDDNGTIQRYEFQAGEIDRVLTPGSEPALLLIEKGLIKG